MPKITTKRVYDPPAPQDGLRVLVDRLWPRGLSKAAARADLWLKDAAPSAELRRWFNHEPERWRGFCARYEAELADAGAALRALDAAAAGHDVITLLYAARDPERNNAAALKAFLERKPPA